MQVGGLLVRYIRRARGDTTVPCPSSGSGSGEAILDPCVVRFNLLLFEYAHLVLFFMGITYSVFIRGRHYGC